MSRMFQAIDEAKKLGIRTKGTEPKVGAHVDNCTEILALIEFRTMAAHPLVGLLGRLNHVAIITPDMEKSRKLYIDLGAKVTETKAVPEWGVNTAFVELPNSKIEFVYPYADDSPVKPWLDAHKEGGLHHICIEVENIHKAIEEAKKKGIRTKGTEPKIGAHGKLCIFLDPQDTGSVNVELEEK
ncbi:unnamed protein product [Anisakis simplex]|uniref:Methylmalonyl-CoA epimerase, mitochondrial (inferred by orthology to a human protein) n=1 Tax=Anisakis simplex TaxID=6269 RepID=A0A0M3KGB4_ANISI|nr:unnamed protein product [Anisakis simplex]